jgi:hypothetical protein
MIGFTHFPLAAIPACLYDCSETHRIARVLESRGFLRRGLDSNRYRLGFIFTISGVGRSGPVRGEATHLFNFVNLSNPGGTLSSTGSFGVVFSAANASAFGVYECFRLADDCCFSVATVRDAQRPSQDNCEIQIYELR